MSCFEWLKMYGMGSYVDFVCNFEIRSRVRVFFMMRLSVFLL